MKPIAYFMNGIILVCNWCAAEYPGTPSAVYGSCFDTQCANCKRPIPANRGYGRAAWKKFLKDQKPT